MFLWENYLNKGKELILENLIFSEVEKRQLEDYQRGNRNWISQTVNEWTVVAAIICTPSDTMKAIYELELSGLIEGIVDDTIGNLNTQKYKNLKSIFDEMMEIRKVTIENVEGLGKIVTTNSIKLVGKLAKKDFTALRQEIGATSELLSSNYDEIIMGLKHLTDESDGSVIDNFVKSSGKDKDVVADILKNISGGKDFRETGAHLIGAVLITQMFVQELLAVRNPTLPMRTPYKIVSLFADTMAEAIDWNNIAAGLVNIFLGTKQANEINAYSTVFMEYSKFSEKLSGDIAKFIQMINANISPKQSQQQIEEVVPQGNKNFIFLETTYKIVDEMKEANQDLYDFATASKKSEMSVMRMSHETLSTPIKKGSLIRTIIGGLVNILVLPGLIKTGDKYKESQMKERAILGEEYAQRAQMFRAEIEIYIADRLNVLTNMMKLIFVDEALREYDGPSGNDPNALQAWKLLSEFDTFIINVNKWVGAFQFEETVQPAKQKMDQAEKDLEQADIAIKNIKNKKKGSPIPNSPDFTPSPNLSSNLSKKTAENGPKFNLEAFPSLIKKDRFDIDKSIS